MFLISPLLENISNLGPTFLGRVKYFIIFKQSLISSVLFVLNQLFINNILYGIEDSEQ